MNEEKIICSNCGAEMNKEARYCMNCGTLNYEHEANKSMKKFLPKNNRKSYEIGSGNLLKGSNEKIHKAIATKTGNKFICFLLVYLLYLLSIVISFLLTVKNDFELINIVESNFSILLLLLSIFFFYIYSFMIIFIKCNKPWWASLIPIYNLIELSDIAFHKKWPALLLLIPVLGQIFFIIMLYKLGEKFDYNGFLIALLPVIGIPMISYGIHLYEKCMYIESNDERELEKEYRRRKIFLITFIIFTLASITMIFSQKMGSEKNNLSLRNYYYINTAQRFTNKVKDAVEKGKITCQYEYSKTNGTYYFLYYDLNDIIYVPLYTLQNIIGGYVRVENNEYGSTYYVSITNGNIGIPETKIEDIKNEDVQNYKSLNTNKAKENTCTIK